MVDSEDLKLDMVPGDDAEDGIIELTQMVEDDPSHGDVIDLTEPAAETDLENFSRSEDLDEKSVVSEDDIRRLLEQTLSEKYGDYVQTLLADTIRTVVEKEMESIKRRLLKGLAGE